MSARLRLAVAVLGLTAAMGCSGARSYVVAPTAEYPISLSSGMRGPDGRLLPTESKLPVGEFRYDYKAWGWLWTIVSFTGDRDISALVNEQVKRAGGDAVTHLSVESHPCAWNLFTLVGLLPDCANVQVRGRIVKVPAPAPGGPGAAPPAPSPPPAVSSLSPGPAFPDPGR